MQSSSIPPEWYPMQAKLAAMELDFDLHMAVCEAEITSAMLLNGNAPVADPPPTKNFVYKLNAILDSLDD